MARNYAALLHEYLEEMDILSDAEFGRLCRALLAYSMDGREGRLEGAEKVLWKRVKKQEDRFRKSYDELAESRRSAGKKGAAKRWQSMADDSENAYTETKTKSETNILPPDGGKNTPARVKPPSFEQVLEAAKLHGCPECAKPFFDYYAAAGWRDSEGKPCAWNWRQKLVAWQMREKQKKGASRQTPKGLTDVGKPDPAEYRKDLERMEKYRNTLKDQEKGEVG